MSNEYIPIVLDIGARFTSIGYVGEPFPTITVASSGIATQIDTKTFPPYFDVSNHSLEDKERELLTKSISGNPLLHQVSEIHRKDQNKGLWFSQKLFVNDSQQQLSGLKSLFSTNLILPPSRCKVIVVQNENSLLYDYFLCKYLLFDLRIKSVMFQPKSLMTLIGANVRNGIVISIGWSSLSVDAIYDLRVLKEHSYRDDKFQTGYSLHYRIIEKLIELNDDNVDQKLLQRSDLFDIIDRFIIMGVYVRPNDTASVEDYQIIESVSIPGRLRYEVIESMFFANYQAPPLPQLICDMIEGTAIDIRNELLENIVFGGGISTIPGFKARLLQELRLVGQRKYLGKMTIGDWSATSLYCANNLLGQSKSVKKIEIKRDTIREMEKDGQVNLVPLGQYIA